MSLRTNFDFIKFRLKVNFFISQLFGPLRSYTYPIISKIKNKKNKGKDQNMEYDGEKDKEKICVLILFSNPLLSVSQFEEKLFFTTRLQK